MVYFICIALSDIHRLRLNDHTSCRPETSRHPPPPNHLSNPNTNPSHELLSCAPHPFLCHDLSRVLARQFPLHQSTLPDESANPPFPKMIRSFCLGLPPTHHFTHGISSREKLLSEFPTVLSFTINFPLRQSRSAGFHTVCHLGSISSRLLADCVLGTQHAPLSVLTLVNPSISRPSSPSRCKRYTTRCPIPLSFPVTSRPRKCRSAFSVSSATLLCKNRDFRVHSRTDIESASRCWLSCGGQSKHA